MGATPPRRFALVHSAALALLLVAVACGPQPAPPPAVTWDSDPDAVILQTTFCCGLTARYSGQSEIVTAQIRGDGQMIWVERVGDQYRERRVWASALSVEQLTTVLQQVVEAGFFDWEAGYYRENSPTDLGEMCLQVSLLSAEHRVCEYAGDGDAPEELHVLYDLMTSGAGSIGEPFVPQQGLVIAYPESPKAYSPPLQPTDGTEWPVEKFGVSLADAGNGVWLKGEALALAWQIVNDDIWQPLAIEGDQYYMLAVMLPGLSIYDLPVGAPAPPE